MIILEPLGYFGHFEILSVFSLFYLFIYFWIFFRSSVVLKENEGSKYARDGGFFVFETKNGLHRQGESWVPCPFFVAGKLVQGASRAAGQSRSG